MKKSIFAIKWRSSGVLSNVSHTTAQILLRRDFFSAGDPSLEEEAAIVSSNANTPASGPVESFMVSCRQEAATVK